MFIMSLNLYKIIYFKILVLAQRFHGFKVKITKTEGKTFQSVVSSYDAFDNTYLETRETE